jgi:hypothetical protein
MAGPGCTIFSGCDNIKTQTIPTLSGIVYKVALVDEEAGIVVLRMNFGAGSVMGGNNEELDVFEAFKVYDGQIHAVEAFMQKVPAGTEFGWEYDATGTDRTVSFPGADAVTTAKVTANGIVVTMGMPFDKALIDLHDLSGRRVTTETVQINRPAGTVLLPVRSLAAGFYLGTCRCCSGNRISHTFRFTVAIPEGR